MAQDLERLTAALASEYAIERELGRGGMSTVYLAHDVKHDRRVALKVLHPELAMSGYHPERFFREIRTVASLTHPQILPLHDSGEADGFLFYVMPFVDGDTLRTRLLVENRLEIREALRIARGVAGALDYAHRQDVLHRDIKPENIFLHEGHVLVSDFGIARAISACCDDLTEAGLAVGTPTYMSPEQASASPEVDGRSDMYSLGCVVYEMLTGAPPFVDGSSWKTLSRHVSEQVPPVRTLRPEVPLAIDEAVIRTLAKDPADRFRSMAEFGDALKASPTALKRADVRAAVGEDRAIAVLPLVNESADPENEYFSDGMTDELIAALAQVEGLRVVSRRSVFALKNEQIDVRAIGAKLGVSAVIEGTVRKIGTRLRITVQLTDVTEGIHLWSERYDRELEDVFSVQEEIAQTIVSKLRETLVENIGDTVPKRYTENITAYNLYLKGRYHWNRRSREGIDEAIKYFESAIAQDPDYALAYSGLADSYALHLDYQEQPVAEGMRRAKGEAVKALELDESLAEAHTSLGWVTFVHDWDWPTALREFERAIELNPRYATAHQWYAWLLVALGRTDEGLKHGRTALELDPASVSIRRSAGWLYYYARQPDIALIHLRRSIAMDPTAEENHRLLGLAYMQKGLHGAAAASFDESLMLSERSANAVAALGYLEALRGRRDETRRLLDELTERAATTFVSPVPFVVLHVALDDTEEALRYLQQAYEQRRGWLAYLNVEPVLDRLRDLPEFQQLVRAMRLP